MMHRPTRLKITDVNPHLICILCGGYLIDATTMIECLHSYCRACIVAYLRQSRQCPRCDTVVHKTRPLLNIRSDKTLQNLVYKLVPNLFKDEMKRRRDFYAKHPQESSSMQSPNAREERGEVCEDSLVIYTEDEHISLSLDYYFAQPRKDELPKMSDKGDTNANGKRPGGEANGLPGDVVEKRYLRCPAAVCIVHIKKFIRNKFGLSPAHRIEVVHQNGEDEPLRDDYTLMDIAYIYTWRRNGPLPLLFRVFEPFSKRRKGSQSSVSSSESVPSTVGSRKASSPASQRQRGSTKSPSPLAAPDEDKHFQKPQAKWKAAPEAAKVPSKPILVPSLDRPAPSKRVAALDRHAAVPQKHHVDAHGKPSAPSASNPVKKVSTTDTQVKKTIIVTSPTLVSTSSVAATSASLVVPKMANISSLIVVNSPKTFSSFSTGKAVSPQPDKSLAKTSSTSAKVDLKLSMAEITSPKVCLTSPKESLPASKAAVASSNLAVSSAKPDVTSAVTGPTVTLTKTQMSPKPTATLSTNSTVTSKPTVSSATPNMTSSHPGTKPPILDMSHMSDAVKPKPDAALQKADIPPKRVSLTGAPESPSQVKESEPAQGDQTGPLPKAKATPPAEKSDKEGTLATAVTKSEDIASKQTKNKIKMDQSALVTAVAKEDHADTKPPEKATPTKKATPNERTTPNEKATPTENSRAPEERMDVSASDGVVLDTPVLLQT